MLKPWISFTSDFCALIQSFLQGEKKKRERGGKREQFRPEENAFTLLTEKLQLFALILRKKGRERKKGDGRAEDSASVRRISRAGPRMLPSFLSPFGGKERKKVIRVGR